MLLSEREERVPTWEEQRDNVVQLLRDRKNAIGGFSGGTINMEEMGGGQARNWPMSAEQIKRGFGVTRRNDPRNEDDSVPQDEWFTTMRLEAHGILEREMGWLSRKMPLLHAAIARVFDEDLGGDRDYERLLTKVARGDARAKAARDRLDAMRREARRLRRGGKRPQAAALERIIDRTLNEESADRETLELCDAGIDVLTGRVLHEDLLVEFARRMSKREEDEMEEQNGQILDDYHERLSRRQGTKAAVRKAVCEKYMISDTTLARLERNHREDLGEPPRPRGRPKKEEENRTPKPRRARPRPVEEQDDETEKLMAAPGGAVEWDTHGMEGAPYERPIDRTRKLKGVHPNNR